LVEHLAFNQNVDGSIPSGPTTKKGKGMSEENKTTVIDVSYWGRGNQSGYLLDDTGNMCCLGFECLTRGFSKLEILGVQMPSGIPKREMPASKIARMAGQLKGLVNNSNHFGGSVFSNVAATINDTRLGECLSCDDFEEKDVINAIGKVQGKILNSDAVRQELLTKLFKHFLNKDLVFINE
jgi:hypothetical protein